MEKLSKPQQRVIDLMTEHPGPFYFIPWGLNYYHLQDANYNYLGRVRYCVFDALVRKDLITCLNPGWKLKTQTNGNKNL